MENISEGSVTHWSEIKGRCDLAEKHVFSQERMMRMNLSKSETDQKYPIELSKFWYITLGQTKYWKNTGWRYVTSVNSGI